MDDEPRTGPRVGNGGGGGTICRLGPPQTLADYRKFTLTAVCGSCERDVELQHVALAGRFGWDVALGEMRHCLRCRRCGTRTGRVLVGAPRCVAGGNNHFSEEVRE